MLETSRSKIVRQLQKEGWHNSGGRKHDLFTHPERAGFIVVPRHKTLSPGVAREIAREAGW